MTIRVVLVDAQADPKCQRALAAQQYAAGDAPTVARFGLVGKVFIAHR